MSYLRIICILLTVAILVGKGSVGILPNLLQKTRYSFSSMKICCCGITTYLCFITQSTVAGFKCDRDCTAQCFLVPLLKVSQYYEDIFFLSNTNKN